MSIYQFSLKIGCFSKIIEGSRNLLLLLLIHELKGFKVKVHPSVWILTQHLVGTTMLIGCFPAQHNDYTPCTWYSFCGLISDGQRRYTMSIPLTTTTRYHILQHSSSEWKWTARITNLTVFVRSGANIMFLPWEAHAAKTSGIRLVRKKRKHSSLPQSVHEILISYSWHLFRALCLQASKLIVISVWRGEYRIFRFAFSI